MQYRDAGRATMDKVLGSNRSVFICTGGEAESLATATGLFISRSLLCQDRLKLVERLKPEFSLPDEIVRFKFLFKSVLTERV